MSANLSRRNFSLLLFAQENLYNKFMWVYILLAFYVNLLISNYSPSLSVLILLILLTFISFYFKKKKFAYISIGFLALLIISTMFYQLSIIYQLLSGVIHELSFLPWTFSPIVFLVSCFFVFKNYKKTKSKKSLLIPWLLIAFITGFITFHSFFNK